ncbi:MAG: hypothetical protein IJT51_03320 [Bacteroidales bacterium]|nr:hypothetical protein [Bacteroidales bacterium]
MKKNFLTKKTFSSLFAATFLTIPLLILQGCGGDASGENTSVSTSSPVYQDLTPGENITIKGRNFSKTSFATVIPQNSSVTIPSEKFPRIGNVFIWDRTVTLNSYEISKYEVTQKLYEYVMGSIPHDDSATRYGNDNHKPPVKRVD